MKRIRVAPPDLPAGWVGFAAELIFARVDAAFPEWPGQGVVTAEEKAEDPDSIGYREEPIVIGICRFQAAGLFSIGKEVAKGGDRICYRQPAISIHIPPLQDGAFRLGVEAVAVGADTCSSKFCEGGAEVSS